MNNINFDSNIINLCSEYDNYIIKGCGFKNKELEIYKNKIKSILDMNKCVTHSLIKKYNAMTKNKLFKNMLDDLENNSPGNKHDKKRIKSLKDGTTLTFYVDTIKTMGIDKEFENLMVDIGSKFIHKKN